MLLLLVCYADVIVAKAELARDAGRWLQLQVPAIEAVAREAHIPVVRVQCDGNVEAQLGALLMAATGS